MWKRVLGWSLPVVWLCVGCSSTEPDPVVSDAEDSVAHGQYLVITGVCNDCHTDGFMQRDFEIPVSQWLTGSRIGWRGPWGTSYPANLRLTVDGMSEDDFVTMAQTRQGLPPMPWALLNRWRDEDLRDVYRFIRSLGPAGEPMPVAVGPDAEPQTPYIDMTPHEPVMVMADAPTHPPAVVPAPSVTPTVVTGP